MRIPASSLSRPVALLTAGFVLFAGVTCTDSLTGPRSGGRGGGLARIGFAPIFSKAAADIYKGLVQFGLSVNNVHVHLQHANGQTAKDTVVTITTGQDSVAIEMSVTLNGSTETLGANVELRDGTQVLFAGTQQIEARAGSLPSSPQIPLEYTGPGAAATTLIVDPPSTTIFTNETLTLHATGKDKNGQVVPDIVVTWSVKEAARGSVDNTGVFTPTATRGATDVVATLPNKITGSAHVSVVPHATKLVVISGGNQVGTVGKALPQTIVIEAQADDNLGVPNEPVTFTVASGGGSVDVASATTDATGRASVKLTLGTTAGTNTIQVAGATVPSVVVSATGNPDNAAKIVLTQQPSATVGSGTVLPTQPKSQLQDGFGNPVAQAGVPVTVALAQSVGQILAGTLTVNTDANGVATFTDLKISGPPGTNALVFSSGTFTSVSSTDIAVQLGPASQLIVVSGEGQGVLPYDILSTPISLKVMDAGGNALTSTSVNFAANVGSNGLVSADGGTSYVASVNVLTDASGVASVGWKVGDAEIQEVTATAGTVSTTFHAYMARRVLLDSPPSLSPQSGVVMPSQPTVHLEDNAGHVVKRADVFISAYVERVDANFDVPIFASGTNYALTDANGVGAFSGMWIEGDIRQHVKLKFFHDIDAIDPDIAVALSATIVLQPGLPSSIMARDQVLHHRLDAPGSATLEYVTTDGYNAVGNAPVLFDVIQAGDNCSITSPTSVNSDASGVAGVRVSTASGSTLVSCVVRGQIDIPLPPCQYECLVYRPAVYQKLYVAPSGVAVWTGAYNSEWNSSVQIAAENWFDKVSPDAGSQVFIPYASLFTSYEPGLTASTTVKSLTVENGAYMYLDLLMSAGNTLTVTGDLDAQGSIYGPGTVLLTGAGAVRSPGWIGALLRIAPSSNYTLSGALLADSLELNEALTLAKDDDIVEVAGALRTLQSGRIDQRLGAVYVAGDVTLSGAKSQISGGAMNINGGLLVTGTASLDQSAGSIYVGGDFKFDLGQMSTWGGGELRLQGNFFYNGNGDNLVLHANAPHSLVMTAATDALGKPVLIKANTNSGLTLGKLSILTSGSYGVAFASPDSLATFWIQDVGVAYGARLQLPLLFTLNAGGVSTLGVHVDANGSFVNSGIINVAGPTLPAGCSPMPQIDIKGLSCVTQ